MKLKIYDLKNGKKTKKGKNPLLVAGDVYRPAAMDQLEVLAGQVGAEVYIERENKNPVDIAKNAIAHAKQNGNNVVIIDTAGRLAVDEKMMDEIANVKSAVNPQEILISTDGGIFYSWCAQILETQPEIIATGCPYCNTMMTDGIKFKEKETEVLVKDIAELIAEANNL